VPAALSLSFCVSLALSAETWQRYISALGLGCCPVLAVICAGLLIDGWMDGWMDVLKAGQAGQRRTRASLLCLHCTRASGSSLTDRLFSPCSASCYLPQLLGGLDVTDGGSGTPQPQPPVFAGDGASDHQQEHAGQMSESRRGSVVQHEQGVVYPSPHGQVHPHVYQEKQDGYPPAYVPQEQQGGYAHEGHGVYDAAAQDAYAVGQDVFAPMDKGGGDMLGHHCEPAALPHSHSSELAYALHPNGGMVRVLSGFTACTCADVSALETGAQHPYARLGYADSTAHGQGHAHPPNGGGADASASSTAFDPAGVKSAHLDYAPEAYDPSQAVGPYASFPPDEQAAAAQAQYQGQYAYHMYPGTPVYASGAVDLGSMCVPASLTVDGMPLEDYGPQYA
jgi:hypothetical protein